eukprot:TRINITY_DN8664_c3_g1_i2.p1 TRINITY_DN8664_c3_g1~~TRINITY_DN8664_c3_g1_i2.p1  ORF type:complete len:204 (+),score=24.96 TRINITY_DN8664_c3_g1_i2:98-709(+)
MDVAAAATFCPGPPLSNLGIACRSVPNLPQPSRIGATSLILAAEEEHLREFRQTLSKSFSGTCRPTTSFERSMHETIRGGRPLPGTTSHDFWASLYAGEPVDGTRMAPPGFSAPRTKNHLATTARTFYDFDDNHAKSLRMARLGSKQPVSKPVEGHFEDSWSQGWNSKKKWLGRKKGLNAKYADEVKIQLGDHVDRDLRDRFK